MSRPGVPVIRDDVAPVGGWAAQAACRDVDPDMFFPPVGKRGTYRAAVAVCGSCPVRVACLDYAITNRIQYGVWGGMNIDQRRKVAGAVRRLRRAMPGHGASRYRRGCRCDECRDGHRAEAVRYRDAAAARKAAL